jgi:hypothetical protein
MEDVNNPGYLTVYNGVQQSTRTQVTLTYPQVQPSRYYRLKLQSKNCGYLSVGTYLVIASGSVPDQPPTAP